MRDHVILFLEVSKAVVNSLQLGELVACKKSADVDLRPGERQWTGIGRVGFSVCADIASVTGTELVNVLNLDGPWAQDGQELRRGKWFQAARR